MSYQIIVFRYTCSMRNNLGKYDCEEGRSRPVTPNGVSKEADLESRATQGPPFAQRTIPVPRSRTTARVCGAAGFIRMNSGR